MIQELLCLAHTGVDLLHQIYSCLPPLPFLLQLVQFVPVASCAAKCTPQMRQASNTLQERNSFIRMKKHNKLVYLLQTRQPLKMAVCVVVHMIINHQLYPLIPSPPLLQFCSLPVYGINPSSVPFIPSNFTKACGGYVRSTTLSTRHTMLQTSSTVTENVLY